MLENSTCSQIFSGLVEVLNMTNMMCLFMPRREGYADLNIKIDFDTSSDSLLKIFVITIHL